jgi:hypothetical protein
VAVTCWTTNVLTSSCWSDIVFVFVCERSYRSRFPGVPVLLCNYHVRKAWLRNLVEKVRDEETQRAMYKELCDLQELAVFTADGAVDKEALDAAVDGAAAAFVTKYSPCAPIFCKYFEEHWWLKPGRLGAHLGVHIYLCIGWHLPFVV